MMHAKYRHALPQMGDALFLTDGGLETTLIFHDGLELPHFAAFDLLRTRARGGRRSRATIAPYVALAQARRARAGAGERDLAVEPGLGREARLFAGGARRGQRRGDRASCRRSATPRRPRRRPMVLSGCLGPRGDGYAPGQPHERRGGRGLPRAGRCGSSRRPGPTWSRAITMTYVEEAIGIARAAKAAGMPAVISFTVETDGCLRSGMALGEAIEACDAATGGYPAYYMVNCAHPTHFRERLAGGGWLERIGGHPGERLEDEP